MRSFTPEVTQKVLYMGWQFTELVVVSARGQTEGNRQGGQRNSSFGEMEEWSLVFHCES